MKKPIAGALRRAFAGAGIAAVAIAFMVMRSESDLAQLHQEEFTLVTGAPFPRSGVFVKAESRDWDLHGDHDTCMLVQVSQEDFSILRDAIGLQHRGENGLAYKSCSDDMNRAIAQLAFEQNAYSANEGGAHKTWALSKDARTVLVAYSSW